MSARGCGPAIRPPSPDAHALLGHIATRLREMQARLDPMGSRAASNGGLASLRLEVPALRHWPAPSLEGEGFYWAGGDGGRQVVGLGRAVQLEAAGKGRLLHLQQGFERLRRDWLYLHADAIDAADTGASAFVGFAFDPDDASMLRHGLPNACLLVPALVLERHEGRCTLRFTMDRAGALDAEQQRHQWLGLVRRLLASSGQAPDTTLPPQSLCTIETTPGATEWLAQVRTALTEIDARRLHKVVLSRRLRVEARHALQPARLCRWLAHYYPQSSRFACVTPHAALVGASPERLVALRDGRIEADAMAGTVPRDSQPERDEELGQSLLQEPKFRAEHRLVVDAVLAALAPLCDHLEPAPTPRLRRLANVQHLWSPIRGRVRNGVSLLQLAERLHPTPAVGGMPRQRALHWLARHGEGNRGWYTGAVGWMSTAGEGELAVVLRCALIDGRRAELYSGAGIVAGSDPETELAETEWKLRTMLDALGLA